MAAVTDDMPADWPFHEEDIRPSDWATDRAWIGRWTAVFLWAAALIIAIGALPTFLLFMGALVWFTLGREPS